MIKLSHIPSWFLIGGKKLRQYLEERNVETLINDYGFDLEYGVDDIEEYYDYFLSVFGCKNCKVDSQI